MIKTLRLSLFSLLVMLCGTVFADTYTYEFTAKVISSAGTATLGDVSWTIATDGDFFGYDTNASNKGQQFGSGNNPCKSLTLSTEDFKGTISEIKVMTSGASSIKGTLNVAVDGKAFGETYTLTTTSTEATFTGSATGKVELNFAQTSSKAIYIKKITVTYSPADANTDVDISIKDTDSDLMKEAKTLAADAEAVAVGKLIDAIGAAQASGNEEALQAAVDQFKQDNAGTTINLTDLVGTTKESWVGNSGTTGSVTTSTGAGVALAELYNSSAAGTKLSQNITNLDNGLYRVKLFATSHNARGEDGAALNGTSNTVAYVFAKSGDVENKTWITASGVTPGFLDGEQTNPHTIDDITVENGELLIGLALAEGGQTGWHTIQIYSLEKVTTAKEKFATIKAQLNDEITTAKASAEANILTTQIATAEAALSNNHLNIEDLAKVLETLKKEEAIAVNAKLVEGASLDNPVAAPFVVNGTFDSNVNGWNRTGGFQNNALASNQQGAFTVPFWENWNGSAKANKMYQEIKNIPNGVYKLNIAAFVNTLQDPNESQYVFANNDKVFLTSIEPTAYEVYTLVEDNTLEVGLEQTTATANWMGIDNVSLIYFGAEGTVDDAKLAAPKNDWKLAKKAAMEVLGADAYKNVTGTEKSALEAEIAKTEPTTAAEYEAATAALKAATKTFTDAAPDYNDLAAANALIVDLPYADASKKPAAKSAETAADAKTAAEEQYAALRPYYESNAKAEGVEFAEDMTEKIVNPAANDETNGWTTTNAESSTGTVKVLNNEPWISADGTATHNYFDGGDWGKDAWNVSFTQDVTLEPGKYLLSAISRASADVELTLLAGDANVKTASIGAAGGVFTRGWNIHNVEFEVAEEGAVTIGMRGVTSLIHNWMSFSDFRLVQLESYVPGTYKGYIAIATTSPADPDTPIQGVTTTTQKVNITKGDEDNSVNIKFAGFQIPVPPLTIENLTLAATTSQNEDEAIVFSSEEQEVKIQSGMMQLTYKTTVEGTQTSAEATPELVLTMKQSAITTIAFAETKEAADSLLNVTLAKRAIVVVPESATIENDWNLSGVVYDGSYEGLVQTPTSIAIDGENIYVQGLAYYFEDAWIKGTIADNKATFKSGQVVGIDEYGIEYLVGSEVDEEGFIPTDDIVFAYDAENHKLTLETSYILECGSKDGEDIWILWSDVDLFKGEIAEPEVVTVPAELKTEDYTMECYEYVQPEKEGEKGSYVKASAAIKIGFDGNDVYVQGLCQDLPEAWIKGTIADDKATFAKGQYFGSITFEYMSKVYELPEFFVGYSTTGIEDLEMTYNSTTGEFTSEDFIVINQYPEKVLSDYYIYAVPTFKKAVADGIQDVTAKNEKLSIFNLNGQMLNKAQKGLNIVNGKKLIRK